MQMISRLQPTADSRALRAGLAFVWLATGLGVLHPYYRNIGEEYLAPLGLTPLIMYLTCAAEVVLGLRLLLGPASAWLTALQVSLIAAFTLILGLSAPELLVDPFGVLSKNVSLVALIVAVWHLEQFGWVWRVESRLRAGLAFIWAWEGLFANFLSDDPTLPAVLQAARIPVGESRLFLQVAGVGQMIAAAALLVLSGRPLRLLLTAQLIGLMVICAVVTNYDPRLWLHPFGPITKNVPLIVATLILFRRHSPRAAEMPVSQP